MEITNNQIKRITKSFEKNFLHYTCEKNYMNKYIKIMS